MKGTSALARQLVLASAAAIAALHQVAEGDIGSSTCVLTARYDVTIYVRCTISRGGDDDSKREGEGEEKRRDGQHEAHM